MKTKLCFVIALLFLIYIHTMEPISAGSSQLPTMEEPVLVSEDYSLAGTLIKIILVLSVIIGLIVLLVKFLAQKNRGWNANRSIRLLGGVALGQNKSMQIVEISGRIYILGIGNEVRLIEIIDDHETATVIIDALTSSVTAEHGASFHNLVQWFKDRRKTSDYQIEDQNMGENLDFQRIFQDKLKQNYSSKIQYIDELSEESNADRSKDKL